MNCASIFRKTALAVLAIIIVLTTVNIFWGDDGLRKANKADRRIARMVEKLMPLEHLSRHALDKEYSKRWLNNFIRVLDYQKCYFLQSDIAEFERNVPKMADWIKEGNVDFAYTIFNRYLLRLDERLAQVEQIFKEPIDFTVNESICTEPDNLDYPVDEAEAKERWRKRVKYDLLLLKVEDTEGKEAIDKLSRRYKSFQRRMHQTDSNELLEMYLTAMTTAYDPHSSYMSADTLENFDIMMRLELEGVGATLSQEDGYTIVKRVEPGGAADKEGTLRAEDKISAVAQGDDGEFEDVVDMKLDDVVKKIRGKAGSVVRLQVIPADGGKVKEIRIVRAKIELKDSAAKGKIFEAGRKPDGTPYKIGVVDLPGFYADMNRMRSGNSEYRSATRDVRRILEDFNSQNVDACIVDLRANGGGSLPESISLTGLFIQTGPVVQVKDSQGNVHCYRDMDSGVVWDKPLVVLISKFSASASEIFAGAIQDHKRGLIVGDYSSHGKGTVQSLIPLGDTLFASGGESPKMGALKVTIQQFYRPDGDSTQNRGVVSDVELPSITSHMDVGESDLDYALPFDKVPAQSYKKSGMVNKAIVNYLCKASATRCSQIEDFQKTVKKIDCYVKNKDKTNITLNEKKFFAERSELIPEDEEKKQLEDSVLNNDGDIKETPYLREVLDITADYLNILNVGVENMPDPSTIKVEPKPADEKKESDKDADKSADKESVKDKTDN